MKRASFYKIFKLAFLFDGRDMVSTPSWSHSVLRCILLARARCEGRNQISLSSIAHFLYSLAKHRSLETIHGIFVLASFQVFL